MAANIISVARSAAHTFSKTSVPEILLLAGFGIEGDAHAGATVRHRYLVKRNPAAPNLAQVHLFHVEQIGELAELGFELQPGEFGENVTTSGLDLPALPLATRLHLGSEAVIEVTGLRTPCTQMNGLRPGLMKACLGKDALGKVVRKAGIMAIVLAGGIVRPGDTIGVELPPGKPRPLGPI